MVSRQKKAQLTDYPRTPHLPYSPGTESDDKKLESDEHFLVMKEVIVTEKLDGENWTGYTDGTTHARSVDSRSCIWQSWAKQFWSQRCRDLPEGWRVCGESMYAEHSISYTNLSGYLYIYSIWDENNICLDWDTTEMWCELLELTPAPLFYRGSYSSSKIMEVFDDYRNHRAKDNVEGFVVRNAKQFHYKDFDQNIAKWVRAGHVKTDEHWTEKWIKGFGITNKLKESD
jgi:hypothetical protein